MTPIRRPQSPLESPADLTLANLLELPERRFELSEKQREAFADLLNWPGFVGFLPEGDYAHFSADSLEWAKGYVSMRFGRLFLGLEEIALEYPAEPGSRPDLAADEVF